MRLCVYEQNTSKSRYYANRELPILPGKEIKISLPRVRAEEVCALGGGGWGGGCGTIRTNHRRRKENYFQMFE